jgi:hypothetical protein
MPCYPSRMLNPQSPSEVRNFFREAWRRFQAREPITPLQALLVSVLEVHPEYAAQWQPEEAAEARDPDTAATFIHLSLHVALREAITADRPTGVRDIWNRLACALGDVHEAEHRMMACLQSVLSDAATHGRPPGDADLLDRLRQL